MAERTSLADQLSFTTTRIACKTTSGEDSVGTGFFFNLSLRTGNSFPVMITDRHVIEDAQHGIFRLTEADENGSPKLGTFTPVYLEPFQDFWIKHPDKDVDLCAMPIDPILQVTEAQGKTFFYRHMGKELIATSEFMSRLCATEGIIMIGYPNGIWDSRNKTPTCRKATAVTLPHLDYEGRREFMIDAACFPESRGCPVIFSSIGEHIIKTEELMFSETEIKLLGVLYAGPKFTTEEKTQTVSMSTKTTPVSVSQLSSNLGLVIKAEVILEFEEIFRAKQRQ
jgi:hypothetical protein